MVQKNQMHIIARHFVPYWYNPRNGQTTKIGQYDTTGYVEFTPNGISKEPNC